MAAQCTTTTHPVDQPPAHTHTIDRSNGESVAFGSRSLALSLSFVALSLCRSMMKNRFLFHFCSPYGRSPSFLFSIRTVYTRTCTHHTRTCTRYTYTRTLISPRTPFTHTHTPYTPPPPHTHTTYPPLNPFSSPSTHTHALCPYDQFHFT